MQNNLIMSEKNIETILEQNLENATKQTFELIEKLGHEKVVFINDKATGLKAIIAIHDTTLGPALGGTRILDYENEQDALNDVLRLSRGMTYKAAISGLNLGGGKAVIIGDPKTVKTPELLRKYGEFIEELNGKYITAEDVNTSPEDLEYVRQTTKHVVGLKDKSGDPSPFTAYGVLQGIKASAFYLWGTKSLKGKKVVVQGLGHVGTYLVDYLLKEEAEIIVSDINEEKVKEILKKDSSIKSIHPNYVVTYAADIYAPTALGATVNKVTIPQFKYKIIAGGANNQLEDEESDSLLLQKYGILHAPDFLINSGGLINVYQELTNGDPTTVHSKIDKIYDKTLEVFNRSNLKSITPIIAAKEIAEEIIHHSRISKN